MCEESLINAICSVTWVTLWKIDTFFGSRFRQHNNNLGDFWSLGYGEDTIILTIFLLFSSYVFAEEGLKKKKLYRLDAVTDFHSSKGGPAITVGHFSRFRLLDDDGSYYKPKKIS